MGSWVDETQAGKESPSLKVYQLKLSKLKCKEKKQQQQKINEGRKEGEIWLVARFYNIYGNLGIGKK